MQRLLRQRSRESGRRAPRQQPPGRLRVAWLPLGAALLLGAMSLLHAAGDIFGNEVLIRGKGIEIRRAALDEAYLQFQANATMRSQVILEGQRPELEAMLLDRLLVTQILLNRASEEDRARGIKQADDFIGKLVVEAGSNRTFERQLLTLGFTRAEFEEQVRERAICEEVVERELRPQAAVGPAEVERYYEENSEKLQRPEVVRVRHVLFSTLDPTTGGAAPDSKRASQRLLADQVKQRADAGEDFIALVREFSNDPAAKENDGLYVLQRGEMAPEFEAAAFSLATNQVSDVVTTAYGYHIIKMLQRIPPEQIPLETIREEIRGRLEQDAVQQRLLPVFVSRLKQEANVEYLHGARPPKVESTAPVAAQP